MAEGTRKPSAILIALPPHLSLALCNCINPTVSQVKSTETTNQKNAVLKKKIMYHYGDNKHSPPQEYVRNAVLSVGRDTGDKCSRHSHHRKQLRCPTLWLWQTWGIKLKLIAQRSDKEFIMDSSQIPTLLCPQSFTGFAMDDY